MSYSRINMAIESSVDHDLTAPESALFALIYLFKDKYSLLYRAHAQ